MRREFGIVVLVVGTGACAHVPCPPGSNLQPGVPLDAQAGPEGSPLCEAGSAIARWGRPAEPDQEVVVDPGRVAVSRRGRPRFEARALCKQGRHSALNSKDLELLADAMVRSGAERVAVTALGAAGATIALDLSRMLTEQGVNVHLRAEAEPSQLPCSDPVAAHVTSRPSGDAPPEGSLDKAEIGDVIRPNLAKFKFCFERQLIADPDVQGGRVVSMFIISPDGTVASSEVLLNTVSPKVGACVAKTMRKLTFPSPRNGGIVFVRYPFEFAVR